MSAYPPQQPKSGFPKWVLIAIIGVIVLVGGAVVLVVAGAGLLFYSASSAVPASSDSPTAPGGPSASPSSKSGTPAAEKPSPTPAQAAAVSGGQTVTWADQGIRWTVPANWTKENEEKTLLNWRSPSPFAFLIANISPMGSPGGFPVEMSLKGYYDQALDKLKRGEVTEAKWLELDGVRGVMWREATPSGKDDPQRLQWIGYRDYLGETQMVNIILSSEAQYADRHEDTLYGILYSTKIPH